MSRSRRVYIIGDNNVIDENVTGVVLINCVGETISVTDNDTTILNNGALVVDADGVTELVPAPKKLGVSGGSTITVGTGEAEYYCDATAGNISITINHTSIPKLFVRIDGSVNTVTLTPASGLINGAASYGLNVQYEKITVLSYNSNLYF